MAQPSSFSTRFGSPRVLALTVEPQQGESFVSFVDRLAARHDVSRAVMLSHLGLIRSPGPRPLPGYGVKLDAADLETFARTARVELQTARSMLLSAYDGTALDLADVDPKDVGTIRRAAAREWAYFSGSHFCAECLRVSEGAWKLAWKLPWSFACATHAVLLHDRCLDCGQRPAFGRGDGSLSPVFHAKVPRPGMCGNVLGKAYGMVGKSATPCGCALGTLPSVDLSKHASLLEIQAALDQALKAGLALQSVDSTKRLFSELRSVAALMLYRAEREDFDKLHDVIRDAVDVHTESRNAARAKRSEFVDGRQGPRPRFYIGAPTSAALMAAIVPSAFNIVQSDTHDELRDRLRPLADRLSVGSAAYRWRTLEYFRFSDRLRAALSECLARNSRFDRRIGQRSDHAKPKWRGLDPCHVPQLVPEDRYRRDFSALFPGVQDTFGRRFTSMALVKLLGPTWAQSARLLDLPSSMARYANRAVIVLNRSGRHDEFGNALHRWAQDLLSENQPVDYAARRVAFNDLRDIPHGDWQALCDAAGLAAGLSGSRSRYACAWLWAHLTCGDWMLAPSLADGDTVNQRERFRQLSKDVLPALAPHLSDYGNRLLDEVLRLKRMS